MKHFMLFFILTATLVYADEFSHRVDAGNAVAATTLGKSYDSLLAPHILQAMRTCIPIGTNDPSNLGEFVVVANVSQRGILSAVEVRPSNHVSQCFTQQISMTHLPPPPKEKARREAIHLPSH